MKQEHKDTPVMTKPKPVWWFREIEECIEVDSEPYAIEYLIIHTGETFIHVGGTAFWKDKLHANDLTNAGITHWRLRLDITGKEDVYRQM